MPSKVRVEKFDSLNRVSLQSTQDQHVFFSWIVFRFKRRGYVLKSEGKEKQKKTCKNTLNMNRLQFAYSDTLIPSKMEVLRFI